MKYCILLTLLISSILNPSLASNMDDESLEIALAISLAEQKEEEERVTQRSISATLPEMRRPHSMLHQPGVSGCSATSHQMDTDACLARVLQEELDNQGQNHRTPKNQLDEDFALALSLDKENEPFRPKPVPSPEDQFFISASERPKLQGMANAYVQILRANIAAGLDVHAFNRAFVIPNRETVMAINRQLKLKEDHSLDTMIAEFQKHNVNTPNLGKALGMLKNYISSHRVDGETGLMLTQIISWNYELAKNVCRYSNNTLFCMPNGDHVSALNYMARSLDENINEKGGCLPGFMGRMFDVNFHFLCELAGVKIS